MAHYGKKSKKMGKGYKAGMKKAKPTKKSYGKK